MTEHERRPGYRAPKPPLSMGRLFMRSMGLGGALSLVVFMAPHADEGLEATKAYMHQLAEKLDQTAPPTTTAPTVPKTVPPTVPVPITEAPTVTTARTTTSETLKPVPKTLDQLRAGHEMISVETQAAIFDASNFVDIDFGTAESSRCTATVLNGQLLVLAHHCIAAKDPKNQDSLSVSIRGQSQKRRDPSGWKVSTLYSYPNDTTYAAVSLTGDAEAKWLNVPVINNEAPQAGDQFFMAPIPGNHTAPVVASSTYLFTDTRGMWVTLMNPENEANNEAVACTPGASGSLAANVNNHYGVLSAMESYEQGTPEYDAEIRRLLLAGKVDVSNLGKFNMCLIAPITSTGADAALKNGLSG